MKTSVNEWKSVQTQAQDNPRAAACLHGADRFRTMLDLQAANGY